MSGMFKPQSRTAEIGVYLFLLVLANQSLHSYTLLIFIHTQRHIHTMHACIVYKVILAVAQRILFKSLSLKWLLLHLHISVPGGKTRINFNKTETAIERQTAIHASDFVTWE